MNLHILPRIGTMELHEVRPRHLRELVLQLRETGKLAPRTIHHVYHLTATLFRTAVAEELIDATPCVLQRGILPKKVDKGPAWRVTATRHRTGAYRPGRSALPDLGDDQVPHGRCHSVATRTDNASPLASDARPADHQVPSLSGDERGVARTRSPAGV